MNYEIPEQNPEMPTVAALKWANDAYLEDRIIVADFIPGGDVWHIPQTEGSKTANCGFEGETSPAEFRLHDMQVCGNCIAWQD
ncbi:hypothetical protein HUG12_16180 [Halorarum salinum]|uniref:Uncharacterized protein n=2 Tax=Halorarum salinum TaxID=2743089 RepID=A0A7D5QM36_9EURY|nr:hypothetical protein HUG12_16180 [Halobaculum salinum]